MLNKIRKIYPTATIKQQDGVKMIFFGDNDEVVIIKNNRYMLAEGHNTTHRKFSNERALLKHINKRRQEELLC